ncbi:hypothetical protein CYMTET_24831, partial [Cymbomonas tetramitiformis]
GPEERRELILAQLVLSQHRSRGKGCMAAYVQLYAGARGEAVVGTGVDDMRKGRQRVAWGGGEYRGLEGRGGDAGVECGRVPCDCPEFSSLMAPKRMRGLIIEWVMVTLERMRVDPEDVKAYKRCSEMRWCSWERRRKAGISQAGSGDGGDAAEAGASASDGWVGGRVLDEAKSTWA